MQILEEQILGMQILVEPGLRYADLSGADFRNANLFGAKINCPIDCPEA